MSLLDDQRALVPALLQEVAVAGGAWASAPAARLAVHRNTVRATLLAGLETAFPVLRRMVGEACFTALALAFSAERPPRRPWLLAWGAEWPDWLAAHPIAADWPCLAPLAALEWARHEAWFAAEAAALAPEALAGLAPERLATLRLRPHPALRLLHAAQPVDALWRAHQRDPVTFDGIDLARAETVLVWRRDGRVEQRALDAGLAALVGALVAGTPLLDAAAAALAADPALDLPAALATLLGTAAFCPHPDAPPPP